jgi:hypothetical protein
MLVISAAFTSNASEDTWTLRATPQAFVADYRQSQQRDSMAGVGVLLFGENRRRGGFSAAYTRNTIGFHGTGADIDENALFASARYYPPASPYGGEWTVRVDAHWVDNNDITNATDVAALAPQISYLNPTRTLYADLGLAYSQYSDSTLSGDDLRVLQWTPTVGFGSRALTDWLQLRGYLIAPSSESRAQGLSGTTALQARWTHWFIDRPLRISSAFLGAMLGQRIYAVDGDAAAVYNLADAERGAASAGLNWASSDRLSVTLLGSAERYRNRTLDDNYVRFLVYVGITGTW